jgi:hypothetical protein
LICLFAGLKMTHGSVILACFYCKTAAPFELGVPIPQILAEVSIMPHLIMSVTAIGAPEELTLIPQISLFFQVVASTKTPHFKQGVL